MPAYRVIHGLWAIFIVYWIVCAFGNKRAKTRQRRGWIAYVMIGAIVASCILSSVRSLNTLLLPINAATQSVGVLLCAVGMAIAIWARRILGKNWSGFVVIKEGHELIQSGPYRFVRHPIYTGIIMAVMGTVIALVPTGRGFLYALLLSVLFYIKALHEERVLTGEFGAEYAAYKERVRAALIPFVL